VKDKVKIKLKVIWSCLAKGSEQTVPWEAQWSRRAELGIRSFSEQAFSTSMPVCGGFGDSRKVPALPSLPGLSTTSSCCIFSLGSAFVTSEPEF
jgi:hypothetical protein